MQAPRKPQKSERRCARALQHWDESAKDRARTMQRQEQLDRSSAAIRTERAAIEQAAPTQAAACARCLYASAHAAMVQRTEVLAALGQREMRRSNRTWPVDAVVAAAVSAESVPACTRCFAA